MTTLPFLSWRRPVVRAAIISLVGVAVLSLLAVALMLEFREFRRNLVQETQRAIVGDAVRSLRNWLPLGIIDTSYLAMLPSISGYARSGTESDRSLAAEDLLRLMKSRGGLAREMLFLSSAGHAGIRVLNPEDGGAPQLLAAPEPETTLPREDNRHLGSPTGAAIMVSPIRPARFDDKTGAPLDPSLRFSTGIHDDSGRHATRYATGVWALTSVMSIQS